MKQIKRENALPLQQFEGLLDRDGMQGIAVAPDRCVGLKEGVDEGFFRRLIERMDAMNNHGRTASCAHKVLFDKS